MNPLSILGAGVGLLGGLAGIFGGQQDLSYLQRYNPEYKENPIAREKVALAKTLLNARMPGAAQAEKNIYANQATTNANVERNATDASQALALAGASQGVTNQAFDQLGMEEAQDYQRRYGNVENAQEGLMREQDKVYQDKVRRFQDLMALKGATNQNQANSWNTVSNLGFGLLNYGLASGMGGQGAGNRYGGGGMGYNRVNAPYAQIPVTPYGNVYPMNPLTTIPYYNQIGGDSRPYGG